MKISSFVGAFTPEMFGAKGDGVTDDYTAMQRLWTDVPDGAVVRLLQDRTYAQSRHAAIDGKNLTVFAYGAKMKLLNGASSDSYTWLAVNRGGNPAALMRRFRWYGGLMDLNGLNQSYVNSLWPGSDGANHNTLGNTGGIGAWWFEDALVQDVEVTGWISEGFCLSGCNRARFVNGTGYDGVPVTFAGNAIQGTAFKVHFDTNANQVGEWVNCHVNKGSIAFHAQSQTPAVTGSTAIQLGCTATDMSQDAFHDEHAEISIKVGCKAIATNPAAYVGQFQLSSLTKYGYVDDCVADGGNIWGWDAALIHGVVSNCYVNDQIAGGTALKAIDLGTSGKGVVRDCLVTAATGILGTAHGGIRAGYIYNTRLTNWGVGTRAADSLVDATGFSFVRDTYDATCDGIANWHGGTLTDCTAGNCASAVQTSAGKCFIDNLKSSNTAGCAVYVDGLTGGTSLDLVKIRGGLFEDFGVDNTLSNPRRAAIGGSGVNGGEALTLNVTGVTIRKTGTYATAYTQGLYWHDTVGRTLIWDSNPLTGITTLNTYTPGGGLLARTSIPLLGGGTWDPPNLASGASQATTFTVTGARVNDPVIGISTNGDLKGTTLFSYVTANDTVTTTQSNLTGAAQDCANQTFSVWVNHLE